MNVSKRTLRSGQGVVLLVVLLFVCLTVALAEGDPAMSHEKIQPELLEKLATGPTDFVIQFAEQADLAPADELDWAARGHYVFDVLTEVAERSQAGAQAELDRRGQTYRSFIAGNEIYVYAGDQPTAQALAALPDVALVRTPVTYTIDPTFESSVQTTTLATPADLVALGPPQTSPLTTQRDLTALAWGVIDTKADQFWGTFGRKGNGIVVASLGTGAEWDHPALDQAYRCISDPGNLSCWYDPANVCGGTPCDNLGISTHTLGTILADDDPALTWQAGMAPDAQWIACKGCESGSCSETSLNACADWILAPDGDPNNRPHIVNAPWGGNGCDNWYLPKVQAWRAAGIFPTFHNGNSGPGCTSLSSPGDYQEVFSSAAHDSSRLIASFSSRGPSCYGHEPYTKPNISAPGMDICGPTPGGGWSCTNDGAAMASAHAAGAAALLWSCSPSLIGQVDTTFEALQGSANTPPAGSCGAPPDGEGNYTYGYGYLDVLAAGVANCLETWRPGPVDPTDFNRYDCAWFDDGSGPLIFNQKVYCLGGRISGVAESPDIWRFDPLTGGWQDTGHDMPEDVSNYTALTLQDENGLGIYVVAGIDIETGTFSDYVQRYYPATGVVETISTDPWPGTIGGNTSTPGGCSSVQNRLYCFGGWRNDTAPYFSDQTWEYDPDRAPGSRWQLIASANLNQARGYLQAAAQGGVLYAIGGISEIIPSPFDLVPTDQVEALDVNDLAAGWQVLASMPTAGGEGRAFAPPWTGKLYVAGGGDWPYQTAAVLEYDLASDSWDPTFPDLIQARRDHAGTYIPLCTPDPEDGLPGMWVFGGRLASDEPPYGEPEYWPLECNRLNLPILHR